MSNRVVVITGASSGIGKAAALKFAADGNRVVLGARRKKLLNELADEVKKLGGEAAVEQVDVTDKEDVERLGRRAVKEFGRIDVWVNDAGVGTMGRFEDIPMEENERIVQTNLFGVMYGSAVALRHFRERRGSGVIINIASFLGKHPAPYQAAYTASKHAVVGLDAALRQELWANGEHDIQVCSVMPVSINTPFFRHAGNHTGHKVQAIPPVYSPEQVADVIVALAEAPKDEVIVGGAGKLMNLQRKLSRNLSDKQMAWMTHHRQYEQSEPAEDSSGTLFETSHEGTGIRDNWPESGKYADAAGAAAAALAPLALGWWLWRKNKAVTKVRDQAA